MARQKKIVKVKEPVTIRFKKLANGNQSIYLDIYVNGVRTYEFLKMYIVPELNEATKIQNKNTMTAVNAIKSQKIIDITNNNANISNASHKSKMLLVDWMEIYKQKKESTSQSDGFARLIDKATKWIVKYKGTNITLRQVDKEYCRNFIVFLQTAKNDKGKVLGQATARNYYKILNCALNKAVKDEIIAINPFNKLSSEEKISQTESTREYLTIEEVKSLIATECKNDAVKRAFLFSCFTGLRCSDVEALRWCDIKTEGKQKSISIKVIKTQRPLSMKLSKYAMMWLPQCTDVNSTNKVFGFPKSNYHNVVLKEWAKDANISKNVSFHVARHTFATLSITANVDLYTISKLLGHTQIKTTQIYSKVMDKKKNDAVDAVSDLFNIQTN